MKKSVLILIMIVLTMMIGCSKESSGSKNTELLHITAMCYANGSDYENGAELLALIYDVNKGSIIKSVQLPNDAVYPTCLYDDMNDKLYLTDSEKNESFDNLYCYDFKSASKEKVTHGKFCFNDLIPLETNQILCNVAPESATVCQPGIFDCKTKDIKYLDANDDDTWFHSLSYNKDTDKILAVTCSDKEMRSDRVCNETWIRPKKLELLSKDFESRQTIFQTEDYEIRTARQLNDTEVILAVDPCMGWDYSARRLFLLNTETKESTEIEIPEITELQSFYPSADGKTIFILGKGKIGKISIYSYSLEDKVLVDLLDDIDSFAGFAEVVDFVYTS